MSTVENERDEQEKDAKPLAAGGSDGDVTAVKAEREAEESEDTEDAKADAGREASADQSDQADEEEDEDEEEEVKPSKSKSGGLHEEPAAAVASEGPGASIFRNTMTIARRETRSYFDSLIAYVVIGGSTLALGIYFFLVSQGGFWQTDRASMSRMFDFLPWMLAVLVIPLVTMRALADEKRSGTLELLITLPVRDSEVILGKYFAALFMCVVLFAATLLYPIALFAGAPWHLGTLDWGPVWSGYLGLLLFSAAGVAVGMLFSSLTESQIIAFFLTAGTLLFFYIIGSVVETVPGVVGDAISFVSFQTRFVPFSRGLLDTRAIIYFVSIAIICLLVAFRSLESRKWS
ncbi:MAG TPA: ABC transporter permease subunit [Polyangiaceae bacterium]|nr:ABC transporter permease subunit [Polyangiaceae bacterium]